jgi:hypothetical protein
VLVPSSGVLVPKAAATVSSGRCVFVSIAAGSAIGVETRAVATRRDGSHPGRDGSRDGSSAEPGGTGIGLRLPGTPRAYLWAGICIAVVLAATYVGIETAIRGFGLSVDAEARHMFDLDAEATVPAYYSGVQLLVVAIAFATVGSRFTGRRRRELDTAAIALVLASLDEVVSLHETVGTWLNHLADAGPPFGHRWWVIPGFVVAVALAWFLRHVLQSLDRRSARLVVLGTAVFFFGALGLEGISSSFSLHSLPYMTEVAFEESAEMIGATIVLYAVLLELCGGPT